MGIAIYLPNSGNERAHGVNLFRAQFAVLVAAGKYFADAAAVVVDEVERGGGGAHEGAFDAVDGGTVFMAQVAVDAAAVRVFLEVVVAARDPSAGQASADFGDDVRRVDDGGHRVFPGGDRLQYVEDARAFGFAPHFRRQVLDDGFQAGRRIGQKRSQESL